ncbi:MAG TPA: YihY/virulence factor BrkB family protein [Phenylobacterium sp.]|uniref:YihY/virulence factor BrkB family protein n=1 Tax=Phenylobacterium sp. TaxID=1871053 RepID=UPI002B48114B|nr:YihY/virulence factor BrkB family protein [Phenylobacterium sp.]HKR89128.1 YihY/virulence factor BrkB family protein [Phenylobacterium sp.]
MGRRRKAKAGKDPATHRRRESLAWDIAPLMVLAGAGLALLQPARPPIARREKGRGRMARSPREISKRGWRDILLRTWSEFFEDQVPMVAAGVTFFTILAIFPGLAAFVALYGLFADVGEVERQLAVLAHFLPPAALNLIGEQMMRLAAADKGGQSAAFLAGFVASVWTANGAIRSLMTGLNIAYEEHERRSWLRRTFVSLAFTLGFLAFSIAAIAFLAAQPAIATFVGTHAATVFGWITWPALVVALIVGLALLYRFGPSREPARWKWITWGSAAVVLFWLATSALFSAYVSGFAHYDQTYGSLGAAIGFMVWIYLSMVVVLAGAELNAEIEHQTTVDTTTGAPRPMGFRRAVMADTVGAAQAP